MEEVKYSFSRLDSFHNCPRAYYYTYIKGNRGGDNIYSFLGTVTHELTQAIIENKETNETAIEKFKESIDDADMLGLEWMSENVKNNYIECIMHFFKNYNPERNDTIKIEDYFEVRIEGVILRGYIDLWYMIDNTIHIIDLKTSSKFSKKDLPKKSRQLILYAIALKEKYPTYDIKLYFNMLKYVLLNNKLLERNKLSIFDEEFQDGTVEVLYTDESISEFKNYIKSTINELNNLNDDDIVEWKMNYNPIKDFFCVNLCSFRENCLQRRLV